MKRLFLLVVIVALWGCGKDLPPVTSTKYVKPADTTSTENADPPYPDNDGWNNEMNDFGPV